MRQITGSIHICALGQQTPAEQPTQTSVLVILIGGDDQGELATIVDLGDLDLADAGLEQPLERPERRLVIGRPLQDLAVGRDGRRRVVQVQLLELTEAELEVERLLGRAQLGLPTERLASSKGFRVLDVRRP